MSGGSASSKRGAAYERELIDRLESNDWAALRLPSSGSATPRELPDVLAGKRVSIPGRGVFTQCFVIELKSGKSTTLYVAHDEVVKLKSFARRMGARPFLGARFTTQGSGTQTWLVPPERARRTDSGLRGLPAADVDERAAVVVSDEGVEWV